MSKNYVKNKMAMAKKKAIDLDVERKKLRGKSVPATQQDIESGNASQDKSQIARNIFTHTDPDKPSKLLGTLANLRDLLNHLGIVVRYNVISKRIFFSIPGESFSVENGEDAAFACIF